MSKPRMNAKVAKLVVGEPVQWSASGIGTVALDNAYEAGHVIMANMPGNADEYWILRPTAEQLAASYVNVWGKRCYDIPAQPAPMQTVELPRPQADSETVVTAEPIYQEYDLERIVEKQYIYGYFSPMRPVSFMTGIDAVMVYSTEQYHDFVFVREPFAAERLAAWELIPWTVAAVAAANPIAIAQEVIKNEEAIAMITNTPADRADTALQAFVATSTADYDTTADQLADLIASSHHLARRLGLDWKNILGDATKRYAATKEATPTVAKQPKAKAAKAPNAASSPAVLWTLEVTLPSGVIANAQRAKPYSHAALICVAGEWSVFAWVSSKETASKRVGDAKRSGIAVTEHKVVEVRIVDAPEASATVDNLIAQERAAEEPLDEQEPASDDPYQIEATVIGQAIVTGNWPRTEEMTALPFEPTDEEQEEIEREVEIDEPMHVKIKGGSAVHYSDDGETTFCGIERDDMRQVDAAVDCRSCAKAAASRAAKA